MTTLKAIPSTDAQDALTKVSRLLAGLASGTYRGADFAVGQTPATGRIRLYEVGANSPAVVEITVGTAAPVVVPVGGLSDSAAATAAANALNADPAASQFVTASTSGDPIVGYSVVLTAKELGPAGNSIGYFALCDYGNVTRSGPFLSGGDSIISML